MDQGNEILLRSYDADRLNEELNNTEENDDFYRSFTGLGDDS